MPALSTHRFAVQKIFCAAVLYLLTSSIAVADLTRLNTDTDFHSVYFFQTESPIITVGLTILAGEVDAEGPEGLPHYLEHLMYWHADNVDDQQIHARGGNAWVNSIVTNYFNQGESEELPDMLEFVHRLFEQPTLNKNFMIRERSVVEREYDLRVSENPDARIYTTARRELYNDLPISRSVIGTPQSIQSLTLEQASQFHEKFYHPANSVLYISGNFTKTEAKQLIEQKFNFDKPGTHHAASWRNARIQEASDIVTEYEHAQVRYDRLIYLTLSKWPDTQDPTHNWYTLQVLRSILDSALDGGIAKPLRMDNFILRSFGLELTKTLSEYFELALFAEPDKGVTLQQSSDVVQSTLIALADAGIPNATLERVKKRMLQTGARHARITNETFNRMHQQLIAGLEPASSQQHLKHIEAVSLKDVNTLLRTLAKPQRRAIAFVKPIGE